MKIGRIAFLAAAVIAVMWPQIAGAQSVSVSADALAARSEAVTGRIVRRGYAQVYNRARVYGGPVSRDATRASILRKPAVLRGDEERIESIGEPILEVGPGGVLAAPYSAAVVVDPTNAMIVTPLGITQRAVIVPHVYAPLELDPYFFRRYQERPRWRTCSGSYFYSWTGWYTRPWGWRSCRPIVHDPCPPRRFHHGHRRDWFRLSSGGGLEIHLDF